MSLVRFIFLFFLLGGVSPLLGAEEKTEKTPTKKTYVDSAHAGVSTTILYISNRIDSFFGSQRGDDEANGSRLRVFYDVGLQQDQKMTREADIRFTLRLPHLENFFKLSFKREGGEDSSKKGEISETKEPQTSAPTPKQLFIRTSKWTFNFNTGLRLDIPPNLFARARLRRTFTFFDAWEFNPTQEATWFKEEGFGLNFSHDLDYPISNSFLFRIVNSAFWRDETDQVTTSHGPTLFHQISQRRAISYSIQAQGTDEPFFYINNYLGAINYRQLVHSNWVYLSVSPSVNFPKEREWNEVYSLFVRLEAVFGTI